MAEVDPDDDGIERHVLFWFRYDPARRERRHCVVAAFDCEAEMAERMTAEGAILEARLAAGEAEACEHLSGCVKEAGYAARWTSRRIDERLGRLDDDVVWLNVTPDRR